MAASSLTAVPLAVLLESESFSSSLSSVDGVTSGGSAKFWLDPRSPSVSWMLLELKEKEKNCVCGVQRTLISCKKVFFLFFFYYYIRLKFIEKKNVLYLSL